MNFQLDDDFGQNAGLDEHEQVLEALFEVNERIFRMQEQLQVILDRQERVLEHVSHRILKPAQRKARSQRRLWSPEENSRFLNAVMRHGLNRHKEIAAELPEREAGSVSSHLQKIEQKWLRAIKIDKKRNYAGSIPQMPLKVPLGIIVEGVAYVRSRLSTEISVEFEPCAAAAAELINNRVADARGHDAESVKFIASDVRMARCSAASYEIGAQQAGLAGVRKWAEEPGFWSRAHELASLCALSNDYRFYAWYVAQLNQLDASAICADFVCAVVEMLAQ